MTDEYDDQTTSQARTRLGRVLRDRWVLDDLLGVGGMAAVYAATHRNGKRVAIKILHPELSANAVVRERFLREGYVANSVNHRGAVSVDDDDVTDDGCPFLVMELLDGETLEARWARKGHRLHVDEVLALMDQVLETLAAGHTTGIVHRDLKPENLFLTREGEVKVLDFGIARVRQVSTSSSKTQQGSMMGTPAFMPPEQARGRWDDVDARTDLWAIGATMFTLLTGEHVHVAGTINEALALAVTAPARPVASVRSDIPREVAALVDRALSYDRDARFPDAMAMQHALRVAYAAWQERQVAGSASTLVSASMPAEAPLPMPSATLSDIPSSSVSTPRGPALTTSRGLGGTLLGSVLKPRARALFALAALGIVVVGTGAYLLSNRDLDSGASLRTSGADAEPPITPAAATAPRQEPLTKNSEGAPVLAIDELPTLQEPPPLASSQLPRGGTTAPRGSTSSAPMVSATRPTPSASPRRVDDRPNPYRSNQPSKGSFDPFAGRE